MEHCSRAELLRVLHEPRQSWSGSGVGLYRRQYDEHGEDFWGYEPGAAVRDFFRLRDAFEDIAVLDLGAGTGKHAFELARRGVSRVDAVEIDSIAALALLDGLVRLENARVIPEGVVCVYKADAREFLRSCTRQYQLVVCYGLLHVFKNRSDLDDFWEHLERVVAVGGVAVIQAITDRYDAPATQPELADVIVNEAWLKSCLSADRWERLYWNDDDIVHSHVGSEHDHRHGSIRAIARRQA